MILDGAILDPGRCEARSLVGAIGTPRVGAIVILVGARHDRLSVQPWVLVGAKRLSVRWPLTRQGPVEFLLAPAERLKDQPQISVVDACGLRL